MNDEARLVAWVGKTDHEAAEGKLAKDLGPIATALAGAQRYQRVYCLAQRFFRRRGWRGLSGLRRPFSRAQVRDLLQRRLAATSHRKRLRD